MPAPSIKNGSVPATGRPAWKALAAHYEKIRYQHLRDLFADDPKRGGHLTAEAADVYLDYSKNRITDETLDLHLQLAEESGLRQRIDAMSRGEKINVTEDRAVLHAALLAPKDGRIFVDGHDVIPQVHAVLNRMAAFCSRGRSGAWAQRAIWQIDPFDQSGVALGKQLAKRIIPEPGSGREPELHHGSSTNALIRRYRKLKETS